MRFELLRSRKNAGMTQQQIAEHLEIPRYKYSKIENGSQKTVDVEMARSTAGDRTAVQKRISRNRNNEYSL